MLSDAASQARDDAGFRDALLSPLGGGRGVGDITQLAKPNAERDRQDAAGLDAGCRCPPTRWR